MKMRNARGKSIAHSQDASESISKTKKTIIFVLFNKKIKQVMIKNIQLKNLPYRKSFSFGEGFRMRQPIILTILLATLYISANAQTTVPAGNVSGKWTKAGSPYKIQGEIIILQGSTLILEPGTVLEFTGLYGIKVDGILKAEGKKGDSISFKAAANKTWSGIYYKNNTQIDTIRFNYCRFENVGQGFKYNFVNYGIQCHSGNPIKIKNTSFYYFYTTVKQAGSIICRKNYAIIDSIYLHSIATEIESTRGNLCIDSMLGFKVGNITTNMKKDILSLSGDISILNCKNGGVLYNISNLNNTSILIGISSSLNALVKNVNISDMAFFGIGNSKKIIIQNMTVKNSIRNAIRSSGDCTGSILENCVFEKCGSTLYQLQYVFALDLQSSGPLFKNCTFKNNETGIDVGQKYGAGTPMFLNCNIINTRSNAAFIEGFPVFINCNIQDNKSLKRYPNDTSLAMPYTGGVTIYKELYNSRPLFFNCLLWNNKDSLGHTNSVVSTNKANKVDFYNCIIQGDSSKGIIGFDDNTEKRFYISNANLTYVNSNGKTPGFIDSAAGNYQLVNTCTQRAYAINKGMAGNLLTQYPFNILNSVYGVNIYNTTDLAGNPRITDDTLDIGCYESSGNKQSLKLLSTYADTTLCYGGKKTSSAKTAGAVQTYQWQQKQGNTVSTISSMPSITLTNLKTTKQYRLKVINNECLPLMDSSAWFTINVNPPIAKGITKNPNKDTITLSQTMQLSTTASGYSSLLWSTGASTPSISFTGSSLGALGTYRFTIEAQNNNGCTETDTVFISTKANTSIFLINNKPNIKLYPQPASDVLNIEIGDEQFTELVEVNTITLSSLDGKILYTQTTNSNHTQIPTSNLETGIYILTFTYNNQTYSTKWVKE